MSAQFDRIPEELLWAPQWCIAGPDKAPYFMSKKGLVRASVTQPSQWKGFEEAVEGLEGTTGCGIGFVLSESDAYCCIDLDVKDSTNEPNPDKWTTPAQIAKFAEIVDRFDSYTERSRSGRGLHIWIRGKVGPGHRRDGVEVYSQERFIICTGDVYMDKPIADRQELLEVLVSQMGGNESTVADLKEVEETEGDAAIYERAAGAENGEKFIELWGGDWNAMGFESQSEADLALLSILTFYSKSNEQCRRLFRMSGLGRREKAVKNNVYLNRTLTLIRTRQEAADIVDHKSILDSNSALMASLNNVSKKGGMETVPPVVLPVEGYGNLNEAPEPPEEPPETTEGLDWPPGVAGALAWYIYQSAPRPVKEVAIVAALGLLAGIVGKTFLIPQSGLNVYIVLVARSAVGKEAMHSGIASLMSKVREAVPSAMNFVDFSDYASGPALAKAVANNQSFVNINGEWGHKLKRLSNDKANDGAMQSLRACMTNLYQKSGPTAIVGGIGYSDKDKNVASVSGVAYSMIGETTPGTFYDSLTESMMEDGFLSRFTVVDYQGDRPAANPNPVTDPHPGLLEIICSLCVQSLTLMDRFTHQYVTRTDEAAAILDEFDIRCDTEINSSDVEGWRQMWNRAHLKAYRFSAILAAADNPLNPVITPTHVNWALTLIKRDIEIMRKRISAGDVGSGDSQRERKILSIIKSYLSKPVSPSYGFPDAIRKEGLVAHRFLLMRVHRVKSFTDHRMGSGVALEQAIKSLIACGYLVELNNAKSVDRLGYHGKVYRVVTLPLDIK